MFIYLKKEKIDYIDVSRDRILNTNKVKDIKIYR